MIVHEERRHLESGPRSDEQPGGAGLVVAILHCPANATAVLTRCREVLRVVIDHQIGRWPKVDEWRQLLPGWFVDSSSDESEEEVEQWLAEWRSLPLDRRAAAEEKRPWSLADWLAWLEPEERQWFWWSASVEDDNTLRVELEVHGSPAPMDAFTWLARAAGATSVDVGGDAVA